MSTKLEYNGKLLVATNDDKIEVCCDDSKMVGDIIIEHLGEDCEKFTKIEYKGKTIAFTEGDKIEIRTAGKKMLGNLKITKGYVESLEAPEILIKSDSLYVLYKNDIVEKIKILVDGEVASVIERGES